MFLNSLFEKGNMEQIPLRIDTLDECFIKGRTKKGMNITNPLIQKILMEFASLENFSGALVGGIAVQMRLFPYVKNQPKYLRKTNDMEFILPPRYESNELAERMKCIKVLGGYSVLKKEDGVFSAELYYADNSKPFRITFYNKIEDANKINNSLNQAELLKIPNKEAYISTISVEDLIAAKAKRLLPKDIYDIQLLTYFYNHELDVEQLQESMNRWVDPKIGNKILRELALV